VQRRTLLKAAAAAAAGTAVGATGAGAATRGSVDTLTFDSTASLLGAGGTAGVDPSLVAVYTEPGAVNVDEDGNGDAVAYPEDDAIPLVAVDGGVAAFGAPFATDDARFSTGNEEFLLNCWDHLGDGEGGTVLWDEGHDQYYTLDQFAAFEGYAEDGGYDVGATTDVAADLGDADGLVVTSPSAAFSDDELAAIDDHLADGGWVVLHHQSDYQNFDETANLDAVADHLGLGVRFNDDQVLDQSNNAGAPFIPQTSNFATDRFGDLFERRSGLGSGYDTGKTYAGTVENVSDGDTVDVRMESGRLESIRLLGVDTPELPENEDAELPEEWEGIDDVDYLGTAGESASAFAKAELADADVTVAFDEAEDLRDPFGRLLAYVDYDGGTSFNRRLLEEGHARLYDSSLARHDEFWAVEDEARSAGRGLWAESDPGGSSTIRNGAVEDVYLPRPAALQVAGGDDVPDDQVVVRAAESADPAGSPLVAVDEDARLAVSAAPPATDDYEDEADLSGYGNFALLTNLADALSGMDDGDVLVEGGHGQFGAGFAESVEGMAFYQRYLEGVGLGLEQVNDVTSADLAGRGRALIVTTPATSFSRDELEAVRQFAEAGGAVVLAGSAAAPDDARIQLNGLANLLGSDLRVGPTAVTDASANLVDDPAVVTTGNVDESFLVFGPYEGDARLRPTPTPTPTPTGDDEGTAPATETSSPGFGALAGLAGLLGAGGALARLRGGDDAE
jgi:PGF-CTERM protein